MLLIVEKVFAVLGAIETGLIVVALAAVIYNNLTFKTQWRGDDNGIPK